LIRTSAWTAKNKDKVIAYKAVWHQENKEYVAKQHSKWQEDNRGKVNATNAKRHAAKLQRTPKWLTREQLKEIEDIYTKAAKLTKETGIKHHVDHIMPLQGKEISGLHVPWNLQILTAIENIKKGTKLKL